MNYRQTRPTMGGMPPSLQRTIHRGDDSIYEITPARGLCSGDYAMSPSNSCEGYCFGLDY
jgi:hypothetical protein